jgi:hypothetical protein
MELQWCVCACTAGWGGGHVGFRVDAVGCLACKYVEERERVWGSHYGRWALVVAVFGAQGKRGAVM